MSVDRSPGAPGAGGAIVPWSSGVAAHFIGLSLWVAYVDGLGREAIGSSPSGLRGPLVGVVVGGLVATLVAYLPAAVGGLRTRLDFEAVAESAFGAAGVSRVVDPVFAVVHVGWFAVATWVATEYVARALVAFRMLDSSTLAPVQLGPISVAGPVVAATLGAWALLFALVGRHASRLVAAIMAVFPVFPAMVIGVALALRFPSLRSISPPMPVLASPRWPDAGASGAIDWIVSFYAASAPTAAAWGASTRDRRGVVLGGIVGVLGASVIVACLGLLLAASAISGGLVPTVGAVLQGRIGGPVGGAMLLVLATGSMAPAVFSAASFGAEFRRSMPGLSRTAWTFLGAGLALPALLLRLPDDPATVFSILGGLSAPILGVVAADALRRPGSWPRPRSGVGLAALLGWAVGVVVALAPIAWRVAGSAAADRPRPSVLAGTAAAFAIQLVFARTGRGRGASAAATEGP